MANIFQRAATGISNIGTKYNLPDFGIGRHLGVKTANAAGPNFIAPYGFSPNAAQQSNIMNSPYLSSPVGGSRQYSQPIGPQQTNIFSRTGAQPAPQKSVFSAPKVGTVPKPGVVGGTQIQTQRAQQSVDPQQQLMNEIETGYSNNKSFLDSLRGNYQQGFGNTEQGIRSGFDAMRPFLTQSRDEGLQAIGLQRQAEQQRERNALDEGLSLYNELQRGTQQRYGGMSSVGRFASDLQNRELQRGQSGIRETATQNMGALQAKELDIQRQHDAQMASIDQQANAAVSQARSQLDDALRQIDMQMGQNEQWKSDMRIEEMRKFQDNRMAVEQQRQQFMQSLGAQALAAQQNIYSALQQFQINAGELPDMNALPGTQFSSFLGQQQSPDAPITQAYRSPRPEDVPQTFRPLFDQEEQPLLGLQ